MVFQSEERLIHWAWMTGSTCSKPRDACWEYWGLFMPFLIGFFLVWGKPPNLKPGPTISWISCGFKTTPLNDAGMNPWCNGMMSPSKSRISWMCWMWFLTVFAFHYHYILLYCLYPICGMSFRYFDVLRSQFLRTQQDGWARWFWVMRIKPPTQTTFQPLNTWKELYPRHLNTSWGLVFLVCFWGPNTFSRRCFGCLGFRKNVWSCLMLGLKVNLPK